MKKHIITLLLLISFILFCIFIHSVKNRSTVLAVITPNLLKITTLEKHSTDTKSVCIENIETFSLTPDEEFIKKHSKNLKLSNRDIISLGYLATEYAQKLLENRQISVKYTGKKTPECNYAQIKFNGIKVEDLIANSGFGIRSDGYINKKKFSKNLENARKLELVILNHHSNKYHKIDCPYGVAATDSVIIPLKHIPSEAKPCKSCFNLFEDKKKHYKNNSSNTLDINNIPQPQLVMTFGDIKTYLTDYTKTLKPNNNCEIAVCKELVQLIDSSKSSIDIAIYGYDNNQQITNALKRANSKGVKIRFVYDSTYNNQNNHYKDNELITNLSQAYNTDSYPSQTISNMIMHNKFIIFDNKTVYTGSMNISRSGLSGYDVNDIIIINSEEISNLYTKEFEQMLNGKFHSYKAKLSDNRNFKLGDNNIEIYFSPKDNVSKRIIELITQAKSYIYMPTFLITNKNIANALIQAKTRGVDVRVITDANGAITGNSKNKLLRTNDILLKTENYAGKLHLKTIIIDDEYLITGSMNFSNSGNNKNDENILIIKNTEIAKLHKKFFLYLWTLIPNKYLKFNAPPESKQSIGSCTDGVDNDFDGTIDEQDSGCK